MITSTQQIPGAGDVRWGTNDPLAQISKVPWDRLTRFQLSKVCLRLKPQIVHESGAKLDDLVAAISNHINMGAVKIGQVIEAANAVLMEEAELRSKNADEAIQKRHILGEAPKSAPQIVEKVVERVVTAEGFSLSELLEIAQAPVERLRDMAAGKGLKIPPTRNRKEIVDILTAQMGLKPSDAA